MDTRRLRDTYEVVAADYAERFVNELDHKPFDRDLLNRYARRIKGRGRVCDLGCGPGHIARYLCDGGVDAFGIDLSGAMVDEARRRNPQIEFREGDMRRLDLPDQSLAGIVCFYSIIHLARDDVVSVLGEQRRVLEPEGLLLLAVHIGEGEVHTERWFDKPVSIDATFYGRDEMEAYLREAGFQVERFEEREPYPNVEYQSRRGYALAVAG
jgi:SAM-dependent methyltransferase